MELDTDFLLVQRMRQGEEKAFESFIKKYYPAILTYCEIHIKDHGYAEDMTQETFIRFFRTFGQYKHYGKAVNYLYVIAANVCKDFFRKKHELLRNDFSELPEKHGNDMEEKLILSEALEALPKELREVAVLFFVQERKQKDIAVILGIGVPLVKYRIRKAGEWLSAYFREEDL